MRKAAIVLLLLSSASPVFAQAPATAGPTAAGSSQTVDDIRKDYRIHVGPFYVNPGVLLKELGMDTNVFNRGDQPQSDFIATVEPKADVALPVARRALLLTTLGTDLVYYRKFATERSVDPQVTARAEIYANRVTLFTEESYLNTRQRPNYEIDLRSRHLQNDFGAGVSVRLTPKVSVEVAAQRGETRYDADAILQGSSLRDTLTRNMTGVSVTGREKLTPLTTVSVRYEQSQDGFPYSPVRDTDSYRIMPGLEFKPKALINGSAFVGYRSFTPKNSIIPSFSGLVSQLALSYTLLGSTIFGVTYDRDTSYSFEVANPYYLDNSVGVFVRRQLGGRFDAIVNAARHRYEYQDLGVQQAAPAAQRVDTTDNYGANVGYRMKGRTRVGFGVSYFTRGSTRVAFRQYDGLHIGTTVTYGF